MTQITLPWVERNPERLATYRQRAIRMLIGLGLAHLALAVAAVFWLKPFDETKLADWKIVPVWILVVGAGLAGLTFLSGGLAVASYRGLKRFIKLSYTPISILLGAVVSVCLIVWLHAWLFAFVQGVGATGEQHIPGIAIGYSHSASDLYTEISKVKLPFTDQHLTIPILGYLLWPLQFSLIRDVIALGALIGFISIIPAFGIWWERKVAGRIQSRMGPMRTGGWHGWAQSAADGIKLVFKEDFIPTGGDAVLFKLAVYIAFMPPIIAFIALPFASAWVFRDLDVALLFILAMLGIEVLGVILAGWASNNKWSVYGAMREACQMVSYEIPMGMALLIPVMMAGTLQLGGVDGVAAQQSGGFWNWIVFANPWCFIAFFIYYAASLASCKRAPFDLPESESELVAGFLTEYSGMRWSLFFFGEYVAMFVVSGLAVILFLGGFQSGLPMAWAPMGSDVGSTFIRGLLFEGPLWFVLKAAALYYVQMWIRWTLPRIRIDQVLYACVQVLLPLTMIVLLANTLWMLGVRHAGWRWFVAMDAAIHWVLVAIGVLMVIGCLSIAAYGFKNNRRLVGSMAAVQLPGA